MSAYKYPVYPHIRYDKPVSLVSKPFLIQSSSILYLGQDKAHKCLLLPQLVVFLSDLIQILNLIRSYFVSLIIMLHDVFH